MRARAATMRPWGPAQKRFGAPSAFSGSAHIGRRPAAAGAGAAVLQWIPSLETAQWRPWLPPWKSRTPSGHAAAAKLVERSDMARGGFMAYSAFSAGFSI